MSGKQVRALRDAMGLTQSEFAARVGVQRNTVARWEAERLVPSATAVLLMEKLAEETRARSRRRRRS